jgi:hypothetical protein
MSAGRTLQSLKPDGPARRLLPELFAEAKQTAASEKASIEGRTQATLLLGARHPPRFEAGQRAADGGG